MKTRKLTKAMALAQILRLMARARRAAQRPRRPGTVGPMEYSKRYGHRLYHISRAMRLGVYRP